MLGSEIVSVTTTIDSHREVVKTLGYIRWSENHLAMTKCLAEIVDNRQPDDFHGLLLSGIFGLVTEDYNEAAEDLEDSRRVLDETTSVGSTYREFFLSELNWLDAVAAFALDTRDSYKLKSLIEATNLSKVRRTNAEWLLDVREPHELSPSVTMAALST